MIAKPPLTARPGWFSDENKWKTTPAASASVAARNFLDDAATSFRSRKEGNNA